MEIKFAQNLCELRKQSNLTQKQLAEALNTTQRKVSYWEKRMVEPDLEMLWLIADFFDVSVDYLIGKENSQFI